MDNILFKLLKLKVEETINKVLDNIIEPNPLADAMKYAVKDGGKRVRPVLCLLGARIAGADENIALPFAVAIELIHSYSLVHDDLPCMDNDDYRRGKLSVHKKFGYDIGVLTGDALLNLAYEILFNEFVTDYSVKKAKAASIISDAAGFKGMIKGQVLDISDEKHPFDEIFRYKTGALIKASVLSGAAAGGASQGLMDSLSEYADNIGTAFQLADDIIDYENGERNKVNFAAVNGIEATLEEINAATVAAKNVLKKYYKHEELCEFADILSRRKK